MFHPNSGKLNPVIAAVKQGVGASTCASQTQPSARVAPLPRAFTYLCEDLFYAPVLLLNAISGSRETGHKQAVNGFHTGNYFIVPSGVPLINLKPSQSPGSGTQTGAKDELEGVTAWVCLRGTIRVTGHQIHGGPEGLSKQETDTLRQARVGGTLTPSHVGSWAPVRPSTKPGCTHQTARCIFSKMWKSPVIGQRNGAECPSSS
ncbi:hypothetical protein P7K49_024667 [Saguinus oedipus]|uniref:Mannose-6-phosphate isomerase n=1 Tax=Saguinus oedipus TaxID=9490 RepID=A0ABQ9UQW4_SAGOE|nr:hypothetical protein P7K49_024667 [Saguinus oedipus]